MSDATTARQGGSCTKAIISAAQVEEAARSGQSAVPVGRDALVTPLARDRARELGVALTYDGTADGVSRGCRGVFPAARPAISDSSRPQPVSDRQGPPVSEGTVRRIVQRVLLTQMPRAFSPALVTEITRRVLAAL